MAKDWSPNQRRFIEWLATPEHDRMPLNQRALATELGVHPVTLSKWRRHPGFMADVNALVDEHLADDYSDITDALKREARKGSFPHQKLYLELIGKYVQKQEVKHDGGVRVVVEYVDADNDNAEAS
jgi:hypothetical protein